MDPQAAWDAMMLAIPADRFDEASEHAEALHEWLLGGGFPPRLTREEGDDTGTQRLVGLAVCRMVMAFADQHESGLEQ